MYCENFIPTNQNTWQIEQWQDIIALCNQLRYVATSGFQELCLCMTMRPYARDGYTCLLYTSRCV